MQNVPWKKLKAYKVLIATPMFGGLSYAGYVLACIQLQKLACEHDLDIAFHFLSNESLVQRGRNALCHDFMHNDFTHLMFIDADIQFNPLDVFRMLAWQKPIIGGSYTKKAINWKRVQRAVLAGYPVEALEVSCGDFALNPKNEDLGKEVKLSRWEPFEVKHIPTGFMLIEKGALVEFQKHYPEQQYRNNHHFYSPWGKIDPKTPIWAYFDCIVDRTDNDVYLSEDYFFCRRLQQMGAQIFLAPWVYLVHNGTYGFKGEFFNSYGVIK